jgi:hypothetical protein
MNLEASRAFMRCLGATQFGNRSGWATCACPFRPWKHQDGSGKASFGLKAGLSSVYAKCLSCDWVGDPLELVYELNILNKQSPSGVKYRFGDAMAILEANPASLLESGQASVDEMTYGASIDYVFPETWLDEFEKAYCAKPADGPKCGEVHPYLEERGMPFEVARKLDMRWDAIKARVCFPVRDYNGQLRGLHGRSVWKDTDLPYLMYLYTDQVTGERHHNAHVWLGEAWVEPEKPVVIVESVFDLARVFQVYRNVICPLTSSLNSVKLQRLTGITEIITLLDNDKAGIKAKDKLKEKVGVPMVHLEHKLPPDLDPGKMTPEFIAEILAPLVDLDEPLLAQPIVEA